MLSLLQETRQSLFGRRHIDGNCGLWVNRQWRRGASVGVQTSTWPIISYLISPPSLPPPFSLSPSSLPPLPPPCSCFFLSPLFSMVSPSSTTSSSTLSGRAGWYVLFYLWKEREGRGGERGSGERGGRRMNEKEGEGRGMIQ